MAVGPVAIVILNYNGARDTAACLHTLGDAIDVAQQAGHGPFHTLVIDNGSELEDVGTLTAHLEGLPWVQFLQNGENVGFSRGVNQGIRLGAELGAEAFLLLNNDTLLDPRALLELLDQYQPDRLLTPLILRYPESDRIWAFGGQVRWGAVPGYLSRTGQRLDSLPAKLRQADILRTGFCTGCALLIPMAVIGRIGLFDETYFAYVEDVDYSLRAQHARIGRYVVPRSIVYHRAGQATGGGYSPRGRYLMGFGTAVCVRQHGTAAQRMRTDLLMRLAVTVGELRERGGPNTGAPKAKWRGYLDGKKAALKHPPLLRTIK